MQPDDAEFDRPLRQVVSYAERVLQGERPDADELPDLSAFADEEPVVLEGPTEIADAAQVGETEPVYHFTSDELAALIEDVQRRERDATFAAARRAAEGRVARREQATATAEAEVTKVEVRPDPKRVDDATKAIMDRLLRRAGAWSR